MYLGEMSGLKIGQATRDAFGNALKELGSQYPEIVTVDGDVGNSTRTEVFANAFPERAFNMGIAESNMVSVAGGLASTGKIPVVASFSAFLLCNAYDQIRMSIAFPSMNVKLVGTHAGISIGEDGPSQMGIEDVSLACSLPGMVVIVTADAVSTKAATAAMIEYEGPVYLRLGRPNVAEIYAEGDTFEIGKANIVREGDDVTIIANGLMVAGAVDAATKLAEEGISARVIDMHTVKPIDVEAIQNAARETGAIVVAEEHLAHGGLGSAVSMVVSQSNPVPMAFVNVGDCFAESGDPQGLLDKYGLTAAAIIDAVKKVK